MGAGKGGEGWGGLWVGGTQVVGHKVVDGMGWGSMVSNTPSNLPPRSLRGTIQPGGKRTRWEKA